MEKAISFNDGAVIYISDNEDEFTKDDFLEAAKGNLEYAKLLFERVQWQSPFTLVDEDLREGEIIEKDGEYILKYDQTHTVYITIKAIISSPEYNQLETMIDELSAESKYNIPSTPNVDVLQTEWVDASSQPPFPNF